MRQRRWVRLLQRYVLNPPVLLGARLGLVPGCVLVETRGRRTGKRRITVVGMYVEGDIGWVVAENGRGAGYASNIAADPAVRVCIRGRWRPARAVLVPDDDAEARLRAFGRPSHVAMVHRFATDLLTVRFDFDVSDAG